MKKIFGTLIALIMCVMFIPNVSAESGAITTGTPQWHPDSKILEAKGTPITIVEEGGITKAKWGDSNEQNIGTDAIVVLGYYDPVCSDSCSINLPETSVTVESGTVKYIMGGNVITKDYNQFTSINVESTEINVKSGKVDFIDVVGGASTSVNVAVPTGKGDDYYSTSEATVNISGGEVKRVMGTTSLTHIDDLNINITGGKVVNSGNNASVGAGTNGTVDNYTVKVSGNAEVADISSGYRAQVKNMKVSAEGNANVGNLYAGSYYPKSEYHDSWDNVGTIDYGTAENIDFDIAENVKYNNIYAGFQFVDLEQFEEEHHEVTIPEAAKTATVAIVAPAPQVAEPEYGATTMFTLAKDNPNITISEPATPEVAPATPSTPQTFDGIIGIGMIGLVSVIGIALSATYLRKRNN